MKRYIAKTEISFSITLQDGNHQRIVFTPLSAGGSIFYTSDKKLQWGLEHHSRFGELFVEDKKYISKETHESPKDLNPQKETEEQVVKVSDFDSAKDYLAEHYDVRRTSIKKEQDILTIAKKLGITFEIG